MSICAKKQFLILFEKQRRSQFMRCCGRTLGTIWPIFNISLRARAFNVSTELENLMSIASFLRTRSHTDGQMDMIKSICNLTMITNIYALYIVLSIANVLTKWLSFGDEYKQNWNVSSFFVRSNGLFIPYTSYGTGYIKFVRMYLTPRKT